MTLKEGINKSLFMTGIIPVSMDLIHDYFPLTYLYNNVYDGSLLYGEHQITLHYDYNTNSKIKNKADFMALYTRIKSSLPLHYIPNLKEHQSYTWGNIIFDIVANKDRDFTEDIKLYKQGKYSLVSEPFKKICIRNIPEYIVTPYNNRERHILWHIFYPNDSTIDILNKTYGLDLTSFVSTKQIQYLSAPNIEQETFNKIEAIREKEKHDNYFIRINQNMYY